MYTGLGTMSHAAICLKNIPALSHWTLSTGYFFVLRTLPTVGSHLIFVEGMNVKSELGMKNFYLI